MVTRVKPSLSFAERLSRLIKKPIDEMFQITNDPNDPRLKGYDSWPYMIKVRSPKHSLDFVERLTRLIIRPANEIFHIAKDPNDPRLKGIDPWVHMIEVVYSDDQQ